MDATRTAKAPAPETLTLVADNQADKPVAGRWYGYSLYHDDTGGRYYWRSRIRTYDGVRVSSSWDSDLSPLQAVDEESAVAEVTDQLTRLVKALNPGA